MKTVVWETAALQEYHDAIAASPNPAAFQHTVDVALNDVASGLVSDACVTGSPARRCDLTSPPYSIIYVESDNEIRVWAFAHHRRKPGYWKRRLPKP